MSALEKWVVLWYEAESTMFTTNSKESAMHCAACSKRTYGDARSAMIALARAVSMASIGDNRRERRFYPCPTGEGFHLTSEAAPSWDRGKYSKLSHMVCLQAEKVLAAA